MKLHRLVERVSGDRDENADLYDTPPVGNTGNYMTSAQAAVMLDVTMGRIRQLVRSGELRSYRPEKGRRDHLFKTSDVRRLKEERKKNAKKDKDK